MLPALLDPRDILFRRDLRFLLDFAFKTFNFLCGAGISAFVGNIYFFPVGAAARGLVVGVGYPATDFLQDVVAPFE